MLSLYTNADGSPRKYPRWVPAPKSETRRNLSAFVSKELTSRKDKQEAQDIISAI
jgi:hypothetical protein